MHGGSTILRTCHRRPPVVDSDLPTRPTMAGAISVGHFYWGNAAGHRLRRQPPHDQSCRRTARHHRWWLDTCLWRVRTPKASKGPASARRRRLCLSDPASRRVRQTCCSRRGKLARLPVAVPFTDRPTGDLVGRYPGVPRPACGAADMHLPRDGEAFLGCGPPASRHRVSRPAKTVSGSGRSLGPPGNRFSSSRHR